MTEPQKNETSTWSATPEDLQIMSALVKKLGLGKTHVIRIALRRFAVAEGLLQNPQPIGVTQ